VFELDQPAVVDFKTRTMGELGAQPSAECRAVSVDLRDDWPQALRDSGFDPSSATACSAEGLLPYLPASAQDQLLDHVSALSAAGSRLIAEDIGGGAEVTERMQERMRQSAAAWRRHGYDLDIADLWYPGERNAVAAYLDARGWTTESTPMSEVYAAHGLTLDHDQGEDTAAFADFGYVTATRR
jgi:methyltransferase (TIGR00027 family)